MLAFALLALRADAVKIALLTQIQFPHSSQQLTAVAPRV